MRYTGPEESRDDNSRVKIVSLDSGLGSYGVLGKWRDSRDCYYSNDYTQGDHDQQERWMISKPDRDPVTGPDRFLRFGQRVTIQCQFWPEWFLSPDGSVDEDHAHRRDVDGTASWPAVDGTGEQGRSRKLEGPGAVGPSATARRVGRHGARRLRHHQHARTVGSRRRVKQPRGPPTIRAAARCHGAVLTPTMPSRWSASGTRATMASSTFRSPRGRALRAAGSPTTTNLQQRVPHRRDGR